MTTLQILIHIFSRQPRPGVHQNILALVGNAAIPQNQEFAVEAHARKHTHTQEGITPVRYLGVFLYYVGFFCISFFRVFVCIGLSVW
jgi:hypothetical protein